MCTVRLVKPTSRDIPLLMVPKWEKGENVIVRRKAIERKLSKLSCEGKEIAACENKIERKEGSTSSRNNVER